MSTAIEFNNISKQYRLGLVSTRTLSHDLNRWWTMNIRGKDDPYLKIGDTNDRATKGSSEYVWALKDINFKVEQGDVVGIIGKNGAGKSTLLKLLSRVTAPTTGSIRAKGRIASLLEVGTGFHPEMTGRENIYMNGAIMGMTRQEIRSKLDEIVDFSGCERYIDTPVKRYSSGMMVRLGFAVAAHLDPEILVVDEVLAVGDAEFQKKAIGKMQDVSKGEGRTVLFVSHNMASMKRLCISGIVLEDGKIKKTGEINSVVDYYMQIQNRVHTIFLDNINFINPSLTLYGIYINNQEQNPILLNQKNRKLHICIDGILSTFGCFSLEFRLYDKNNIPLVFYSPFHYSGTVTKISQGKFHIEQIVELPENMNKGTFYGSLFLTDPGKEYYVKLEKSVIIEYEGYTTETGCVFDYNSGSGFLFLH